MAEAPDRNLALELVRVTEAAALAAARWVGLGDKNAADQAAVDAMRYMLESVEMDGIVVIGEGQKDEAPMLYNGERIGSGRGGAVDVAVDPLEGTELCARGQPNALAVIAASDRGTMFDPGPCVYMEKLAVGPDVGEEIDINAPIEHTLELVARAKRVRPRDLMVVILDRPRHEEMVKRIRAVGTRIRFIPHGDVSGALMAASPDTGVRPALGHRRDTRRGPLGGGVQMPRRPVPGQAVATQREGTAGRARGRLRRRPSSHR